MLHALKIEWMKVKNYRAFIILSILFIISIFGLNYIAWYVESIRQREASETNILVAAGLFEFPRVWNTISYLSSFLHFIPGLLMIMSVTNEYSYKTHRQNIIDGWSRTRFIHVKMLDAVILAFASTLLVFITALLFGMSTGDDVSFDNFGYIGRYFLQSLSHISVALVISLLLKRSGLAIGVFFLYMVVIENLLWALMMEYATKIAYYLPLESNDALIPNPFLENVTKQFMSRPDSTYLFIAAFAYLILYYFFSRRKFENADL